MLKMMILTMMMLTKKMLFDGMLRAAVTTTESSTTIKVEIAIPHMYECATNLHGDAFLDFILLCCGCVK